MEKAAVNMEEARDLVEQELAMRSTDGLPKLAKKRMGYHRQFLLSEANSRNRYYVPFVYSGPLFRSLTT